MNKVAAFTDSTADLTKEIYEKRNINVIPFIVTIGDEEFRDGINLDSKKLFEIVEMKKTMPSTAAASPEYYYQSIEPFIKNGYDIIFIGIGKELSAGYKIANKVKEMLPKDRFF